VYCNGAYWGLVMCRSKREKVQPRPKGDQASRCVLVRPQEVISRAAHSAADWKPGDPVSLGPFTSVSWNRWSMTCDDLSASALIRCTTTKSTLSWARVETSNGKASRSKYECDFIVRRFMEERIAGRISVRPQNIALFPDNSWLRLIGLPECLRATSVVAHQDQVGASRANLEKAPCALFRPAISN
jgi:hypothetical protein